MYEDGFAITGLVCGNGSCFLVGGLDLWNCCLAESDEQILVLWLERGDCRFGLAMRVGIVDWFAIVLRLSSARNDVQNQDTAGSCRK